MSKKFILMSVIAIFIFVYPSVILADGNDEYTKLLIHSDTTDESDDIIDSSVQTHEISDEGDVHHETDAEKFGDSSIYFDGNGDYLEITDDEDWYFSDGDFTIDFWVNFDLSALSTHQCLYSQFQSTINYSAILKYPNNDIWLTFTPGCQYRYSWSPTAGQWYHIAVVRDGTNMRLFIDGSQVTPYQTDVAIGSSAIPDHVDDVNIGRFHSGNTCPFKGYMDEYRISKGIARWTSNFTPPPEPYVECTADYNGDNTVDIDDLLDKQQDLQDWINNCWSGAADCD